ncbi:MAG: SanA protein [Clostridiales bacterium]|nr:SanA protein [Clostridiales bacterium]
MEQTKRPFIKRKRLFAWALFLLAAAAALPFLVSGFVKLSVKNRILSPEEAAMMGYDCILVLGAGVWGEGDSAYPSHMLEDRLLTAISLYENNAGKKLLMSGDHGTTDYDEVNVMRSFALERGVPSEDIFMDHAGFSTYESLYRARDVFEAKRVLIVTQGYHLYRALYVAKALGLDAGGVAADLRPYRGQSYYDLREVLARCKDAAMCILKPAPTYLGDAIPISGSGEATFG